MVKIKDMNLGIRKKAAIYDDWKFKKIKRDSPLGSKKFVYSGILVDSIGEEKEMKVIAKDTASLKKKLRRHVLGSGGY